MSQNNFFRLQALAFTLVAAAGSLNRRLTSSRGKANSLCVLFYYLGGACGITLAGWAYSLATWPWLVALGLVVLDVVLGAGYKTLREDRQESAAGI